MKTLLSAVAAGAFLMFAALFCTSQRAELFAQRPASYGAGSEGGLLAMACPVGNDREQITVIDPRMRVMSIYQIDHATGKISLKSVRNITWDLKMDVYDSPGISPREIRELLEIQHR